MTATAVPETSAAPTTGVDTEGTLPPSSRQEMDDALRVLSEKKDEWARLRVRDRRAIVHELRKDFALVAERWVEACLRGEVIRPDTTMAGEEWLAGPYFVARNLRLLEEALEDIEREGRPAIPGPVTTRDGGQVTAQVFPQNLYDQLFYSGITAEVWMDPEVSRDELEKTQAVTYHLDDPQGVVSLVLGAGNVSSIAPMDILYKLFVENQVVITKMHPVNDYLGPIMADGFRALLDWGVLRIVYGGAAEGAYLCQHPAVEAIHITGSDRTVEAIVFGPGEEGARRKAERRPRLEKPITSELGNVSPVIVVPGPWTQDDLAYQGENLASMLTNNAGFNCNATRVVIQHAGWPQRAELLSAFHRALAEVPTRHAFYPGAEARFAAFMEEHPEARQLGEAGQGELPWAVIPDVDPTAEDAITFHTEAFCGVCSETAIEADTVAEYLERAVSFANRKLWGTLNASILVHPASLADPEISEAVERAVADLRYGTVSINNWAAIGYGLVVTPWGAYPGHDVYDIQSGTGVVHNTVMFSRVQKTVVRSPFRMWPKPVWFPSHKTALRLGRKLTEFEAAPSPWKLPGIFWEALRG